MTKRESQQSVLVVDDDPDIVTALQDLLEYEGFHVDCAQTCRQALASIEENYYNAVLLDLGLPDGDGQNVLNRLQESDPSLPVIVLTAATSMDRKLGSLTQGAFAHLTKPYHREELRAILHRAIGMKSLATRAEGIAVALWKARIGFVQWSNRPRMPLLWPTSMAILRHGTMPLPPCSNIVPTKCWASPSRFSCRCGTAKRMKWEWSA